MRLSVRLSVSCPSCGVAQSFLCLAHHVVHLWCLLKHCPRGATNPVQIHCKCRHFLASFQGRWPSFDQTDWLFLVLHLVCASDTRHTCTPRPHSASCVRGSRGSLSLCRATVMASTVIYSHLQSSTVIYLLSPCFKYGWP